MNQTLINFDAKTNLVKEYKHWSVLLRPKQSTFCSLLLIAKDDVTEFNKLSTETFHEKQKVIQDIESVLQKELGAYRVNYLMLMMVDPNVHYHVIPRYREKTLWSDVLFEDAGAKNPLLLEDTTHLDTEKRQKLIEFLQAIWPV